jgi:hypothetical protein
MTLYKDQARHSVQFHLASHAFQICIHRQYLVNASIHPRLKTLGFRHGYSLYVQTS